MRKPSWHCKQQWFRCKDWTNSDWIRTGGCETPVLILLFDRKCLTEDNKGTGQDGTMKFRREFTVMSGKKANETQFATYIHTVEERRGKKKKSWDWLIFLDWGPH